MKRAIALRHVAFEDLGLLDRLFQSNGHAPVYHDAGVDDLASVVPAAGDLLVVLGGPIGAYEDDRYPFIPEELRLIERALKANVPVLGICLGAQLLARVLGARVYPGPHKEIGIAPIELTPEGSASCLRHLAPTRHVFHWHGDTFDLPAGAVRLASTANTPNQAFALGPKVLGLQFHIEAEPSRIERWLVGHACELAGAGIDVAGLRQELDSLLPNVAQSGQLVIADWLGELPAR